MDLSILTAVVESASRANKYETSKRSLTLMIYMVGSDLETYGKEYPANRYAAVLWDHGGGTLHGFGVDEIYPGDEIRYRITDIYNNQYLTESLTI